MRRSKGGREADVFIPPGYKAGDGVKQAAEITNTDGRTCNLYLGGKGDGRMETCMGGDVTAIVLTRAKQENTGGEKTESSQRK